METQICKQCEREFEGAEDYCSEGCYMDFMDSLNEAQDQWERDIKERYHDLTGGY